MFNIVKRQDFMLGQDIPTWREAEELRLEKYGREHMLKQLGDIFTDAVALLAARKQRDWSGSALAPLAFMTAQSYARRPADPAVAPYWRADLACARITSSLAAHSRSTSKRSAAGRPPAKEIMPGRDETASMRRIRAIVRTKQDAKKPDRHKLERASFCCVPGVWNFAKIIIGLACSRRVLEFQPDSILISLPTHILAPLIRAASIAA
jgi:hypothetical protein